MLFGIRLLHMHNAVVGSISFVCCPSSQQISKQILNVALLWSFLTFRQAEWNKLRFFLALNAAVDATFSLTEALTQMVGGFLAMLQVFFESNGTLIIFATGPISALGPVATKFFLCTYCDLVYASFLVIPATFTYRYYMLIPWEIFFVL